MSSTESIPTHSPEVPVREVRCCEVCGVPATERTLIGLKNDRRRNGPRWCLSHHPSSMNATAVVAVVL